MTQKLYFRERRLNDSMGSFIADEVIKALISNGKAVKNAKVLILGITFKEKLS